MNFVLTLFGIINSTEINGVPQPGLTDTRLKDALQIVFGFGGALALLIIVVAGLRYVTSQGDPNGITKSKNTIIYALVGLVICAIAFSIVTFVVGRI